jgi:hypothetical protein
MPSYAPPVTDDLLARLTEAIEAKASKAEAARTVLILPRRNGKATLFPFLADNDPNAVLRRCDADRRIVAAYRLTAESSDLHADAWMVMRSVIRDLATAYGVA